jgi:hypothetical protein
MLVPIVPRETKMDSDASDSATYRAETYRRSDSPDTRESSLSSRLGCWGFVDALNWIAEDHHRRRRLVRGVVSSTQNPVQPG